MWNAPEYVPTGLLGGGLVTARAGGEVTAAVAPPGTVAVPLMDVPVDVLVTAATIVYPPPLTLKVPLLKVPERDGVAVARDKKTRGGRTLRGHGWLDPRQQARQHRDAARLE